jgi:hypothetical protein
MLIAEYMRAALPRCEVYFSYASRPAELVFVKRIQENKKAVHCIVFLYTSYGAIVTCSRSFPILAISVSGKCTVVFRVNGTYTSSAFRYVRLHIPSPARAAWPGFPGVDAMRRMPRSVVSIALAVLGSLASAARAEEPPRVEITPFVGYRMGGQFDVENSQTGAENSVDAKDSDSWGVDFGIYRDNLSFYEFLYSRQSAGLNTDLPAFNDVNLKTEYLQFGGTMFYPQDTWFVPYLSMTLGATRFDPQIGGFGAETKFSMSLGGGMRMPINKRVAATLGVRGYMTFVDSDTKIFCVSGTGGGNCLIKSSGNAFFQGEAQLGLTFVF